MEAGYYRELCVGRGAVKDGGKQRYNRGGDITKESEEYKSEGVERGYEELKEMYSENIIS